MLRAINDAKKAFSIDSLAIVPGKIGENDEDATYDAILVVYSNGIRVNDSTIEAKSFSKNFIYVDTERSPTCPIECDNGDYRNPPWQ
jgi:hypothetical protein